MPPGTRQNTSNEKQQIPSVDEDMHKLEFSDTVGIGYHFPFFYF